MPFFLHCFFEKTSVSWGRMVWSRTYVQSVDQNQVVYYTNEGTVPCISMYIISTRGQNNFASHTASTCHPSTYVHTMSHRLFYVYIYIMLKYCPSTKSYGIYVPYCPINSSDAKKTRIARALERLAPTAGVRLGLFRLFRGITVWWTSRW